MKSYIPSILYIYLNIFSTLQWLQLPICPVLWRQKETKIGQVTATTTTITTTSTCCPETKDCHRSYAHPPEHVLNQALASGFVVCCQAFVFSNYAPDDGTVFRPKCKRGEESCRYGFKIIKKINKTCPKGFGLKLANLGLQTPLKSQAEPS